MKRVLGAILSSGVAICGIGLAASAAASPQAEPLAANCAVESDLVSAERMADLRRGVNLPGWDRPEVDEETIAAGLQILRSHGFSHIRLPVDDRELFSYGRDGFDNRDYLEAVRRKIDKLSELGFVVSLDLHPSGLVGDLFATDPDLAFKTVRLIWAELAGVVRSFDPSEVLVELLNEPSTDEETWNKGLPGLVASVRELLPDHTFVVAPAGPQRHETLPGMPCLNDRNLIFAIHYYDPFYFTHQGADWDPDDRVLPALHDIPFPADRESGRVRALLSELRQGGKGHAAARLEEWLAEPFTGDHIQTVFDRVGEWSEQSGRPVIVNEFGAYRDHASEPDRRRWLAAVTAAAESNCIGWAHWDYFDGFGLVDPEIGLPDPGILAALTGEALEDTSQPVTVAARRDDGENDAEPACDG